MAGSRRREPKRSRDQPTVIPPLATQTKFMLCWLSKIVINRRLDEGGIAPAWANAHLARCAACRAHHERERHLVEQLSACAAHDRREAPPFLHARILANLDRSPVTAPNRFASTWAMALGGGLAIGVLLLAFHFRTMPVRPTNTAASSQLASFDPITNLPTRESILAFSAKFDEPLETELRLVMDDARMAVSSLSRRFVPEEVLAQWR